MEVDQSLFRENDYDFVLFFRFPIQSPEHVEDLSVALQDFYQFYQKRLQNHQYFKSLNDEDITKIMDFAEKYITVYCYKQLFCPPVTTDEEKGKKLIF